MQPHSVVVYFFLVIFTFVNVNCQWNTNEENISPESESIVLVRIRFFGPTRELTSGDGNQPFLGQPISMPHFLRLHAPVQQTLLVPEQTSLRIWQLLPPTNNQPSSIESNAENPQISNDPPLEQDEPKTGSPFDFLTNMLDEKKDLTKTRKSLQVPEAKDLINKYGENLTLFAPNDKAFDDAVQDGSNDEELEKNFVDNHFIVGQRVPIFPSKPTMFDSIDDYPKVLRPNIIVPGGPLVHIIDRVNTKPFNAMSILTMQPAVSAMLKLIKTFDMTNILDKPTSFFCPDNQIINNILQSPKTIPEIVKRFISDHIIESPNPGCHHAMRSSSGRPVSCVETSTNIILNGRIFEKRKVPTLTGVVFIIPGVMFDDADYLPQLFASKQPQKFKLVLIPINETITNKPLIKLPFYQPNDEDKPKSPRQVEPEENATTTEMGETDLEENPLPSEPNNPKQQNFNENDNNKEPDKPDLNKNWSTEPSELSTEAPNNPIESNPVNPLTNPAVDDEPEFNNEPTEEPNYPEETISPINPNVNTENSKQPIDSVTREPRQRPTVPNEFSRPPDDDNINDYDDDLTEPQTGLLGPDIRKPNDQKQDENIIDIEPRRTRPTRPRVKPNQPLNDDNNPIQTPTPLNDEPNDDDPFKLEPESLNDDPTEEPSKRNRPRQDDPKDSIEEETPRRSRPNNEPSTEPPSDDYEPVEDEPPKQPKQKPTKKKTPKRPKSNDKPSTEPPSEDYEPSEEEPPKRSKTKPSTESPSEDYEPDEEEPPKQPKQKPTKKTTPKRPKSNNKPSTEPLFDDYEPDEEEPPKQPKQKPTKKKTSKRPKSNDKPSTEPPSDDYEPVEDEPPKRPKTKPSTEPPLDDYEPNEEEPPKRPKPKPTKEKPKRPKPNDKPSTEPPFDDYEPDEEEPPKQPKQKPTKKTTPKRPKPNDKPSTEPPFDDYEPVEDEPPKRPKTKPSTEPPLDDYEPDEEEPPKRPKPKPTKEKPKRLKPNDKPSTEPPSDDYEPVEDEPPKRPKTKPSTEPPLDDYEPNEEEPPKRPKPKPTKEKPKRPKPNDKPSTEPPSDDYDPVEDEPPKRPETKLSTKAPLDDYEPYEDEPPKQTKPKPTKERRPKKPILYNKPSTEQPLDDYEPVEDEPPKQPKPKPTQEKSPKKSRPNVKPSTESPFDDYDPIEEEPTKRPKPKQGKPLPRTRLRIKPTTEPPLDDYDPFEEEPNPTPSRRTTRRPSTEPDYEEETPRLKNRRKPTRRPSKPISDDTQRTTTTTETYTEEPYEITSTTSKPQLPPFPPTSSSMMEQEPIEQKPDDSYMPDFEPSNIVPNIDPSQIKQMLGKSAQKLKCGRFFDWLINSGVLDDLLRKYGNKNCTVFMPIDNAASKLPFDMMQTLNNEPQRQKQLMQLHTVPDSFQQIYPSQQQSPSSFRPVPTMNSNQLRFDRSLLKNQNGQYVPLLSGCPMLDSHQIGPIRMVSLGSVIFPPQPNVYSVMKRSPNLRLCREIVDQSGMGPLMRDPKQSFTFFTPSDKALQKRYSQRQLNSLVQDPNACKNFVNQHMIKNRMVYANSLPLSPEQELDPNFGGRTIAMRSNSNDPLRIRRTAQSLFVNDAHVGFQDISCKNGVMHVMNDYF